MKKGVKHRLRILGQSVCLFTDQKQLTMEMKINDIMITEHQFSEQPIHV